MKSFKKAVAVLVWCAVSVGCVAEEVTQPAVAEVPPVLVEAVAQEKEKSSGDDEITITDHVDSETGHSYQELQGDFVINKFNVLHIGNSIVFGVNRLSVIYTYPAESRKPVPSGTITYPDGRNLQDFMGKRLRVYCRVSQPFNLTIKNNEFCSDVKKIKFDCAYNDDQDFQFDHHCTLLGNKKYFIIFE